MVICRKKPYKVTSYPMDSPILLIHVISHYRHRA
jgi:hypothetical protein